MRPRILWTTHEHTWVGNAFGYNSHNANMRRVCRELMDFDETAPVALTITPADKFVRIPGKLNILFTMFETLDIPGSYVKNINKADVLIVPSKFCKDIFSKYTNKPIYVCWEGVDPDKYPFYQRKFPRLDYGERFRFLWVGAPNHRKGYPLLLEAIKIFEEIPKVEIYLKTTVQKINWYESAVNTWKNRKYIFRRDKEAKRWHTAVIRMIRRIPRPSLSDRLEAFGKYKNIIRDTRNLPMNELIDLYNSAHCFVLPTFGEGWGLTLSEAMATGAPCIATAITGCADFFNESVGYPINHEIKRLELANYDLKTEAYIPDTHHMLDQMMHVLGHYHEALKKGRKASDRIRTKFTWQNAGKRLTQIIEEVYPHEEININSSVDPAPALAAV